MLVGYVIEDGGTKEAEGERAFIEGEGGDVNVNTRPECGRVPWRTKNNAAGRRENDNHRKCQPQPRRAASTLAHRVPAMSTQTRKCAVLPVDRQAPVALSRRL
jgi:hypothetical protein